MGTYRTWARNSKDEAGDVVRLNAQVQFLTLKYKRLEDANKALLEYRRRNTLNFSLEKADDFIRRIAEIIGEDMPNSLDVLEELTREV